MIAAHAPACAVSSHGARMLRAMNHEDFEGPILGYLALAIALAMMFAA
jgi:hypothetical protein